MMTVGLGALALCLGTPAAQAWHVSGKVLCDANGNQQIDAADTPAANVMVVVENSAGTYSVASAVLADGSFHIDLPHTSQSYVAYLRATTLPAGATLVLPAAGTFAIALTDANQQFEQANFLLNCPTGPVAQSDLGARTPGYWKNHPEAWPVQSITLGGVTYTKWQAIALMKNGDDRAQTIFMHLIATRLNLLAGTASGCIVETVEAADAWLTQFPVGTGVRANSAAWKTAEPWKDKLDDYNNGKLCAPKGN
jgi:hypothetical protein